MQQNLALHAFQKNAGAACQKWASKLLISLLFRPRFPLASGLEDSSYHATRAVAT